MKVKTYRPTGEVVEVEHSTRQYIVTCECVHRAVWDRDVSSTQHISVMANSHQEAGELGVSACESMLNEEYGGGMVSGYYVEVVSKIYYKVGDLVLSTRH